MFRRIRGERGSVQDERRKRGGRLRLGAFCVGVVALLAAAQPVAGMSPSSADPLHSNLDSRLGALDADGRTSVVVQLDAPATEARIASLEDQVGPLGGVRRFSVVN